jgi:hypothetical protein
MTYFGALPQFATPTCQSVVFKLHRWDLHRSGTLTADASRLYAPALSAQYGYRFCQLSRRRRTWPLPQNFR